MARTLAAMQAGRLRWLAKLKAEGKPIPCGRKKGGRNAPLEERRLTAAVTRLVRARAALRRANSASPEYRRKRQEARQEAKIEVQRLLAEHEEQRRAFGMPPLSGDALYRVIQGLRLRAAVSVPFDPTPRWPNVRELEDKVRDAEDALERAKADAVRTDRELQDARRRQERSEDRRRAADHARRMTCMEANLPYWTDEEVENY
jgi:hypothetical protein